MECMQCYKGFPLRIPYNDIELSQMTQCVSIWAQYCRLVTASYKLQSLPLTPVTYFATTTNVLLHFIHLETFTEM